MSRAATRQSAHPGLLIFASAGGLFLASLDFSINVSLPLIRDDLGESLVTVQWIILIYHASRSGMGFGAGGLGDTFGLRRVFLVGILLNTVAVGVIALQGALPGVVGLRVLQGIGAGILFTVSPALVARAFGPAHRGAALGVTIAAVGAGQVTATLGGGWLAQTLGWEAIFWTRVPIGLFFLLLGLLLVKGWVAEGEGGRARGFDWTGMSALYLALFMVVLVFGFARVDGWTAASTVASAGIAAVMIGWFVVVERRASRPILPGALLRHARFRAGAASNLLGTTAIFVMWFLFPFFVADSLGRSPVGLGAMLATMGALTFVGSSAGGWLADRFGDRAMTLLASGATAAALLWMATIQATATLPEVALRAAAIGLAFGLHQAAVYALTLRRVPTTQAGSASAALAVTQTLGTVLSVSLGTIVLTWRQELALADGLDQAAAFVQAYGDTFVVASLTAVAAGLVAIGGIGSRSLRSVLASVRLRWR